MANALQRVSAGTPVVFAAETWNAFIDAARFSQRAQKAGNTPSLDTTSNPAVLLVRNRSGLTVPWYGVLAIGGQNPMFPPTTAEDAFKQQVVMEGVAPTGAGQAFAVVLEPLEDAAFGRACVAGAVPVQVHVTDVTHRFATTAADDVEALVSAEAAGVVILSRPVGTGLQWLYVLMCCQDGWAPPWEPPSGYSGSGSGGGGGIRLPCCADPYPETLTLTFHDGTIGCTCLNGFTVTMTWSVDSWFGTAAAPVGCAIGGTMSFRVQPCINSGCASSFLLTGDCGGSWTPHSGAADGGATDSPLSVTWSELGFQSMCGCAGKFKATLTE